MNTWNTVVPEGLGEREENPTTMRLPTSTKMRLKAVADERGTSLTEVAVRILNKGLDEIEASGTKKRAPARLKRSA